MVEEKFSELPRERQVDILEELRDAEQNHTKIDLAIEEHDDTIDRNRAKLLEMESSFLEDRVAFKKLPLKERIEKRPKIYEAIKARGESRAAIPQAMIENMKNADALKDADAKIDQLWKLVET